MFAGLTCHMESMAPNVASRITKTMLICTAGNFHSSLCVFVLDWDSAHPAAVKQDLGSVSCIAASVFCNGAHPPENPVLRVLMLSSFQDGAIVYLSSPVCRRIPFTVFSQEHLLLEINLLRVGEVSRSRNRSRKASHKQAREAATSFHVSVFVCPSGLSRKIALTSEWFFSPMLIGS